MWYRALEPSSFAFGTNVLTSSAEKGLEEQGRVSFLRPQPGAFNEHLFLTLPDKCPTDRMGLSGVKGNKNGTGGQSFWWAPEEKQAQAQWVPEKSRRSPSLPTRTFAAILSLPPLLPPQMP